MIIDYLLFISIDNHCYLLCLCISDFKIDNINYNGTSVYLTIGKEKMGIPINCKKKSLLINILLILNS